MTIDCCSYFRVLIVQSSDWHSLYRSVLMAPEDREPVVCRITRAPPEHIHCRTTTTTNAPISDNPIFNVQTIDRWVNLWSRHFFSFMFGFCFVFTSHGHDKEKSKMIFLLKESTWNEYSFWLDCRRLELSSQIGESSRRQSKHEQKIENNKKDKTTRKQNKKSTRKKKKSPFT